MLCSIFYYEIFISMFFFRRSQKKNAGKIYQHYGHSISLWIFHYGKHHYGKHHYGAIWDISTNKHNKVWGAGSRSQNMCRRWPRRPLVMAHGMDDENVTFKKIKTQLWTDFCTCGLPGNLIFSLFLTYFTIGVYLLYVFRVIVHDCHVIMSSFLLN